MRDYKYIWGLRDEEDVMDVIRVAGDSLGGM